jgi:V/A-type H+-transporting ATPase subunit C
MPSSARNTYLHTRVSVLAGRLLSPAEGRALSRLDLEQIGRRYGLEAILEESIPAAARNRAVERSLIRSLMSELSLLIRPMYGEARELVLYWARKFELYNLKALIRGKLSGEDEKAIEDNLYDVPKALALPHTHLLRTESVLELLRQLEQSPYRVIAGQARQVFEDRHEPFALEATIDQSYYAGLVKRARELQGVDSKEMQQVVGLQLDQLNLLWLLRYRFYYGLSPTETYYQLVPSARKLHRSVLLKLVDLPEFDKVIEALPHPLDEVLQGLESAVEVERRMEHYSAELLRRLLRHSPSAVARALAYLVLREMDQRRLFAAVQGRVLMLRSELLNYAVSPGSSTNAEEMAGV